MHWTMLSMTLLLIPGLWAGETTRGLPPAPGILATEHEVYEYPIPRDEDCSELAVGSSRIVNYSDREAHAHLGSRYRVSRLGSQLYRIDLNLDFSVHVERIRQRVQSMPITEQNRVDLHTHTAGVNQMEADALLRRSQQCLNLHEPRLRSRDGTRFKIFLNSEDPRYRAPRSAPVNIMSSQFDRTDSTNWAHAIDCSVIVHEIFHHLGLPDGYISNNAARNSTPEEMNAYIIANTPHHCSRDHSIAGPAGSCRHVEPTGMMSDYYHALGNRVRDGLICEPNSPTVNRARSYVNGPLPDACPQGYQVLERLRMAIAVPDSIGEWAARRRDGLIAFYHEYQNTSLPALGNAHSRYIVNPRCVSGNRRYLTCVQNAARNATRAGCLPTPSYCQGDFIND